MQGRPGNEGTVKWYLLYLVASALLIWDLWEAQLLEPNNEQVKA